MANDNTREETILAMGRAEQRYFTAMEIVRYLEQGIRLAIGAKASSMVTDPTINLRTWAYVERMKAARQLRDAVVAVSKLDPPFVWTDIENH